MKTVRENVNFKIWKMGRKWIQCYVSFEVKGIKQNTQAKVLITDSLKDKKEGEWINNLPAEIQISVNSFSGKTEVEVYPLSVVSNTFTFKFGKHKFSTIEEVAEKDFFYLTYLNSLETVIPEVSSYLSNYKFSYSSRELKYWAGEEYIPYNHTEEYEEIEGYEFFKQNSSVVDDWVSTTTVYKKI